MNIYGHIPGYIPRLSPPSRNRTTRSSFSYLLFFFRPIDKTLLASPVSLALTLSTSLKSTDHFPTALNLVLRLLGLDAHAHCLSTMKALIRPVSIHAASSPIETIVFFFVLSTLAYFHVLSAIKHSSFFAPTSLPPLRPSHALWHNGDWATVQESEWHSTLAHPSHVPAVDLQQLVMSFDARTAKKVYFSYPCLIYMH